MYSQLNAQMIRTRQEEIAARTIHPQDVVNVRADATSDRGPIRRRAWKGIAAFGVCVAATSVVAISDVSAHPRAAKQGNRVSTRQFQREMDALKATGFVASSCRVGGMVMTNYSTHQSVLLSWS
ncbi:MAG TPA: hypothetical protein VEF89_02390 [Solirubrobacteraceae bacterium]|nr:hypothetical protein [Solirubrobacteraceae bacterium]